MEAKIITNIVIDLFESDSPVVIPAKQGDSDSRFILGTIKGSGEVFLLDETFVVKANFLRGDGERFSVSAETADGKALFQIPEEVLEFPERVKGDISIEDADDRKLTTSLFYIQVEPSCSA